MSERASRQNSSLGAYSQGFQLSNNSLPTRDGPADNLPAGKRASTSYRAPLPPSVPASGLGAPGSTDHRSAPLQHDGSDRFDFLGDDLFSGMGGTPAPLSCHTPMSFGWQSPPGLSQPLSHGDQPSAAAQPAVPAFSSFAFDVGGSYDALPSTTPTIPPALPAQHQPPAVAQGRTRTPEETTAFIQQKIRAAPGPLTDTNTFPFRLHAAVTQCIEDEQARHSAGTTGGKPLAKWEAYYFNNDSSDANNRRYRLVLGDLMQLFLGGYLAACTTVDPQTVLAANGDVYIRNIIYSAAMKWGIRFTFHGTTRALTLEHPTPGALTPEGANLALIRDTPVIRKGRAVVNAPPKKADLEAQVAALQGRVEVLERAAASDKDRIASLEATVSQLQQAVAALVRVLPGRGNTQPYGAMGDSAFDLGAGQPTRVLRQPVMVQRDVHQASSSAAAPAESMLGEELFDDALLIDTLSRGGPYSYLP